MNKTIVNSLMVIFAVFVLAYVIFEHQKRQHQHQLALADKAIEAQKLLSEQNAKAENKQVWGGAIVEMLKQIPLLASLFG